MSGHVHDYECSKSGGACHDRGNRCNTPHPDIKALACARLDDHAGEHDAFRPGMRRIRWGAA